MKRRGKYNNKKTVVDGITFDSKKEAGHYKVLKALEKAKKISDLELQPSYRLEVNSQLICRYRADFRYKEKVGRKLVEVVCDVKGVRTGMYRIKKKLMKAIYGIDIQEV